MKKIESRGWKTRMQALCLMLLCVCALFGVAGSAFAQDLPAAETTATVVETAEAVTFDLLRHFARDRWRELQALQEPA